MLHHRTLLLTCGAGVSCHMSVVHCSLHIHHHNSVSKNMLPMLGLLAMLTAASVVSGAFTCTGWQLVIAKLVAVSAHVNASMQKH